jgi:hypothetical protein
LVGLFDESPWKIGRTLFDCAIFPFADIRAHQLDLVLIATMPNSQQRVAEKLRAACDPRTEIRGLAPAGAGRL